MLTTLTLTFSMLVWLTLPFYDFCGFRSVSVNSVYKLQFLHLSRIGPIKRCYFLMLHRHTLCSVSCTISEK